MQAGSAGAGGMHAWQVHVEAFAHLILIIHHFLHIGGAIGSGSCKNRIILLAQAQPLLG